MYKIHHPQCLITITIISCFHAWKHLNGFQLRLNFHNKAFSGLEIWFYPLLSSHKSVHPAQIRTETNCFCSWYKCSTSEILNASVWIIAWQIKAESTTPMPMLRFYTVLLFFFCILSGLHSVAYLMQPKIKK